MGSIAKITADRARTTESLQLADGLVSQWLSVGEYRSCFCVAKQSTASAWAIQGLLPDRQIIELGSYDFNTLFKPSMPRYITVNAMCGLPIRFVSSVLQTNPKLWVIFKS
jgi:hypothetical protein